MTSKIHPTAIIEQGAKIGAGCDIGAYAFVGEHVTLGDGCKLYTHAIVMGHTTLGARCTVWPNAIVGGDSQDLKFKGEVTFIEIGAGTTIRECATINGGTGAGTKTIVGENCHIMAYAHVSHNCRVGNGVILVNCVALGGEVEVGDRAILGGLSGVHQFVRIGTMAIVGGSSKVTQDIPPYMMADGHPAKVHTINKVGLERGGIPEEIQRHLKQAYKILFRENHTTRVALEKIEKEIPPSPQIQTLVEFIKNSKRGVGK
jgi:UDP-N-acetylglucosamine acyltransferase